MAYEKGIGSDNPGCIIILVDQSASMAGLYGNGTEQKQHIVTRAINRVIDELVMGCAVGEEIKDRCHVCVIGYGIEVHRAIEGMISDVGESPLRLETVKRKESNGAGGIIEKEEQMPIWLEPKAGNGTPMDEAFQLAYDVAQVWCTWHPDSFPPIVVNITDGAPYDPDATQDAAKKVMELETTDGKVLVFNIHISDSDGARDVILPHNTNQLEGDHYAEFLFDISSILPEFLVQYLVDTGLELQSNARCFGYNASEFDMIRLLNFASSLGSFRPWWY